MKEFVISEAQVETAVLVGLITKTQDERKTNEYLDELAFLAETAGAEVVKRFTQKLDQANSVTYVGKGKLEEIKEYIRSEEEAEREIGMVIFDDELSAKQIRNIEAELKIKILDRTSLILDIFAMRAQTANAKTQVELAQYKYMLPRLQRLWTHLERHPEECRNSAFECEGELPGLRAECRVVVHVKSAVGDRLPLAARFAHHIEGLGAGKVFQVGGDGERTCAGAPDIFQVVFDAVGRGVGTLAVGVAAREHGTDAVPCQRSFEFFLHVEPLGVGF